MNGNGDLGKYFEGLNERLDAITVELVSVKETIQAQKSVQDAMQGTQQALIKTQYQLIEKVGQLDSGQERLIALVAKIAERLTDFEEGATVELDNVDFNQNAHTLRATIRRVRR